MGTATGERSGSEENYRVPTIVFGFVEIADDVNTRPNIPAFAISVVVASAAFALKFVKEASDERRMQLFAHHPPPRTSILHSSFRGRV